MVQLPPALTVAFRQWSVSAKSPVTVTAVGTSAMLPVFVRVTVCVPLVLPYAWLAKLSEAGANVAVVSCVPAVHRGICQIPRPKVPAANTSTEATAGEALSATTGACGRPAPNGAQQFEAPAAQIPICRVENTPASVARYTVFASRGSTTTLLAGVSGRFDESAAQCAHPSVERYKTRTACWGLPIPSTVT